MQQVYWRQCKPVGQHSLRRYRIAERVAAQLDGGLDENPVTAVQITLRDGRGT
jgi:hypothetical protein